MLYKEAFIEDAGWRWRFHSTDEGLFHISYQEWDAEKKVWIDKGPADALHSAAKDQIIAAINTVCETSG